MGRSGGVNHKVLEANERKAVQVAEKERQAAAAAERKEAADWSRGANNRGAKRADDSASKEAQKLAKLADKRRAQAEDEEMMNAVAKPKKPAGKKKTDIPPWEAALAGSVKKGGKKKPWEIEAEKKKEEKRKEDERKAEEKKQEKEALAKAMAGMDTSNVMDHKVNNKPLSSEEGGAAAEDEDWSSGIDAALDRLAIDANGGRKGSMTGLGAGVIPAGSKNLKALYRAFEDREMVKMREDKPGLRLRQYRERIFEMWRRSPENPLNKPREEQKEAGESSLRT